MNDPPGRDDHVVRLGVLGDVVLFDDAGVVRFGRGRTAAVLAVLLQHVGRSLPVEEIVDAVWYDDAPRTAATMVHGAVQRIRTMVDPGRGTGPGRLISTRDGAYVVERAAWVDAPEFERRLAGAAGAGRDGAAVRVLTGALDLWRGPAYAGIEQAFARDEARRLDGLRLDAVELLATAHLERGVPTDAVGVLSPLVAAHPERESAAAQLMVALYRSDRPSDALAVYDRVRRTLADELGVDPGAALRRVADAVRSGRGELRGTGSRAPSRLPLPADRLLGRESDVVRVDALVRTRRLVTVTGPGGSGKTRLAIEVGHRSEMRALFVDLTRVGRSDPVEEAVADAVGVRSPGRWPARSVADALVGEPTLVVLDSCEHVLERCARFAAELVAAGGHVHVLATSRVRLGAAGEHVQLLAPLAVPDEDSDRPEAFPSVQLFVARATAAGSGFVPTPSATGVAAEICRRLDGLPLAVELAAARTSSMPVRDVLSGLDDRFGLLDRPDRPDRGLSATIAWSHDLLSGPERTVFAALSVFPGSFDRRAVGAVAGVDDGGLAAAMARLVELHLVAVVDATGANWRYRLLETTREFARGRAPDAAALRRAHASHYLAVAGDASTHLHRAGAGPWLDLLHGERHNLAAALEWASAHDDDVLIGLAASLWHYWDVRGSREEGIRWLDAGLAALDARSPDRMVFLSALALLHLGRAEFDATERLAADQLVLARAAADRRWVGDALAMRATVAWARGRFDHARQLYEDAVAASLDGGDVWRAAMEEAQLARLHRDRGEPDAARVLAARSAAHADDVGEDLARGLARDVLASVEHRWGERTVAAGLVAEALTLYRTVGYREGEASALHLSGRIASADGDDDRAADEIARALEIYRRIGHRAGVTETMESLARLATG